MRLFILTLLLLLVTAPSVLQAHSIFQGGMANNSPPPPQTIASINLSPTTFTATGGTATVGTISVVMTPSSPTFLGSVALGIGAGCAGTDNAGFSVSGTTLQTTHGAGTYSIGLVARI